jgi:hypothetical protein
VPIKRARRGAVNVNFIVVTEPKGTVKINEARLPGREEEEETSEFESLSSLQSCASSCRIDS